MSRRKVRGLTRTGRQVSEDPDIDNLLSTLSPEEMEELEKEVLTAPDPDPNEVFGSRQGHRLEKQPSLNNNTEAKSDPGTRDSRRYIQRELSLEGEPRRESRKQEYLRKMGLSQERSLSRSASQDDGPQRKSSISSDVGGKTEARNCQERGAPKEDQETPQKIWDREILEGKGKEKEEESKKKADNTSKTKELISKLRENKENGKERERREEGRKREEGKTKELISRLQERKETEERKEREIKDEMKRKDDGKTKGLVSRLEEKQSLVKDCRTELKKDRGEQKSSSEQQNELQEKGGSKLNEKEIKERDGEIEKESARGERKRLSEEKQKEERDKKEKERDERERRTARENESGNDRFSKLSSKEKPSNGQCPVSKTKEEEEVDDSASMFDEPLEKVRNNDPSMTELNLNNSEVIKTKTLIQFAEALKDNTHVKTFALANTRADDHVAYAIAGTLRANKTITSINMDSNLLTSKGIISLIQALQHNATLTELRFHNQRHICGGKTEMEMAKVLKDNTTLLKLGYHFELAGPRMTMTNILSRNMDKQRQKRLQEQKLAQANGEKKGGGALEVPKPGGGGSLRGSPKPSPKPSPQPSPLPSPIPSPKVTPKRISAGTGGGGAGSGTPPPPAPPPPPPAPLIDGDFLRNSLSPVSQRKLDETGAGRRGGKNARDQLLASIRNSNIKQLKKVAVPKLLQ
ncbi:hypothetical protein GJAV_G00182310 [Gymnothorax javanicus]|nr:hypothetical protein GJAV_G00182310 [Gymnothorax javanicus]